jgi:hypothetical protein
MIAPYISTDQLNTYLQPGLEEKYPISKKYNPYKEALLNPMTGPLVGVPTTIPIDTHRVRIKVSGQITTTTGNLTILANPVHALCNDALTNIDVSGTTQLFGAINYKAGGKIDGNDAYFSYITSNSPYSKSQFAGYTNSSSVRARVVGATLRICNVSNGNTRNGVFTLLHDTQHNTLQDKFASDAAKDQKAVQFNAGTQDWHNLTYHPTMPEEVDGWVWDPKAGYQGGVTTGAYRGGGIGIGAPLDGTPQDTFPGYMGVWWNGDTASQTFQVEMYVIGEYVGSLVAPLQRDIGADSSMQSDAHKAAEACTAYSTPQTEGATSTGHPFRDAAKTGAKRALNFAESVAEPTLADIKQYATAAVRYAAQRGMTQVTERFFPTVARAGRAAAGAVPYLVEMA